MIFATLLFLTSTTGTVYKDQCTFMVIFRWTLRMRNVTDRFVEKIKHTIYVQWPFFFLGKSYRLWDVGKYGTARQATDENIIRRMRSACWITKVTDTHSEYVILVAFQRQEWSRERAWMLRYTCIACLVNTRVLPCTFGMFVASHTCVQCLSVCRTLLSSPKRLRCFDKVL